ncbi:MULTISPECIES: hypothetical protein [unclassified Methanoregula]|uniref:IS1096 element passenger TnpR family protein n=1 Tax=unclassified Methanoregula TaxID=2649730 RepID=UPI0009C642FA|nr:MULTISPECIES: hypothetical protein [unclassified Methanoregula]OPX64276.1 MAG: Plasmid pRiA4b ORF-3-like protein [Methanoregula sp. PtaB.Bin085]OPY33599.1 MAG: Plasmid pRiA4b ORF-3-like protein [Methanoregula sp. PtaU1.Bin006]
MVLEVPGECSLYDFAIFILANFDFDDDHAFGFYNHLTRYTEATEAYELFYDNKDTRMECPPFVRSVKKTLVKTAFPEPGKKMLFLFDYGDNWQFRIELLEIEPAGSRKPYPKCRERHGKPCSQYGDDDNEEGAGDHF